jgi:UPF0755 protein
MTKRKKKFFVIFTFLFILAIFLVGIDFYHKVFTPYKEYQGSVIIQIKKGASISSVGKLLYKEKIIPSYTYFRIYYRLFFNRQSIKTGEYQFDRPLKMREVIEKLIMGRVLLYKATIKEGLIIKEIAEVLRKDLKIPPENFIKAANNVSLIQNLDSKADDLEGYLFPDTYFVRKNITAQDMVAFMVKKFKDNFSHTMRWRAEQLNLSFREVITLASLIEKETSSRAERFLISSVFHNRLRIGMPMGCDPTIIYALKRDNLYQGKLTWKNLKYNSPYNTRLHAGLPPGPICSPGYASIEAALYPENTKYLYFVAKDSKTHYFSKTLKEHNWAVRKYIINKSK